MTIGPSLRCEIFPGDLNACADFYVSTLGFEIVDDRRSGEHPYLSLARGVVRIGASLSTANPAEGVRRPPVGVELVLEVDDVIGERDRVVATGWPLAADLTARPWGLRDFRVTDPDGYYWRITDRR